MGEIQVIHSGHVFTYLHIYADAYAIYTYNVYFLYVSASCHVLF